ncbi:hypothetical protein V6Z12_D07G118300 [Gossypium hirsutum]
MKMKTSIKKLDLVYMSIQGIKKSNVRNLIGKKIKRWSNRSIFSEQIRGVTMFWVLVSYVLPVTEFSACVVVTLQLL